MNHINIYLVAYFNINNYEHILINYIIIMDNLIIILRNDDIIYIFFCSIAEDLRHSLI